MTTETQACNRCSSKAVGSQRIEGGVKHRCTVCGRSWTVRDVVASTSRTPRELPNPESLYWSELN